ncbi:unnamed protein product [Penicillium nalgiovense]|nr:unnamed protein product [Penicillium nalgiovense]CAG8218830.1 unnamed protein product [Penicillium nalgiovense]CAG8897843.1 unnamed protein product [Penicillium nalgiovense]
MVSLPRTDPLETAPPPRTAPLPRTAPPPRTAHCPPGVSLPKYCWICCRPIELSNYAPDTWKNVFQPLHISGDKGHLVPVRRHSLAEQPAVHACCWKVAELVLGRSSFDPQLLNTIANHLFNLRLFAKPTSYNCETNGLDYALFAEPDALSETADEDICRDNFSPEFFQQCFALLDQQPNVITIDQVERVDPCLACWISEWNQYDLQNDKNLNIRSCVQRIVKNIKECDQSRFPKTYNFRVAWSNVHEAVNAMNNSPLPIFVANDPQLPASPYRRKQCIPAKTCRRLELIFSSYVSSPCLSGIAYDGKLLGLKLRSSKSYHVRINDLKGLVLGRNSVGSITAIKVKNGENWSQWYGEPQSACSDIELEWENQNKMLIFHIDVGS